MIPQLKVLNANLPREKFYSKFDKTYFNEKKNTQFQHLLIHTATIKSFFLHSAVLQM